MGIDFWCGSLPQLRLVEVIATLKALSRDWRRCDRLFPPSNHPGAFLRYVTEDRSLRYVTQIRGGRCTGRRPRHQTGAPCVQRACLAGTRGRHHSRQMITSSRRSVVKFSVPVGKSANAKPRNAFGLDSVCARPVNAKSDQIRPQRNDQISC